MKRFHNILVLIADNDRGLAALKRAASLAKQNSAKLTLVQVIDPLPKVPDAEIGEAKKLDKERESKALSRLEQIAAPLRDSGIQAGYSVLRGKPAEQAVSLVYKHGYDLVMKTAQEPEGVFRRLFGTTGWRLFRNCPCPVWIIKETPEAKIGSVLAAVDPAPAGEERDPQNLKILQLASSIARNDGAELHVVYVAPDNATLSNTKSAETGTLDPKSDKASLGECALAELITSFQDAGQIDHVHFRVGVPGEVIPKLARELKVELLVIGSVSRNGMKEFLIGNTAERVLDQIDCSVLTLKPDDFVVPLHT